MDILVIPTFLVALIVAPVDFIFNEGEFLKGTYEAACTAGGGEYQESNSEACPGLIFGTGPTPQEG